jgi:cell division septation protein DedD
VIFWQKRIESQQVKTMRYTLIICSILFSSLVRAPANAQESRGQRSYASGGDVHVVPAVLVKRTLDATFASPFSEPSLDTPRHAPQYRVRVGTFAVKENATRLRGRLESGGYSVDIRPWHSPTKGQLYTVSVGSYRTADEAKRSLNDISKKFNIDGLTVASSN